MIVTATKARNNLSRYLAAAKRGKPVIIIQKGERFELRSVRRPPALPRYSAAEVDRALDRQYVRLLNGAARASR